MDNIRTMNFLLVVLVIVSVAFTGYSIYKDAEAEKALAQHIWDLENEPDPLIIERVPGDSKLSVCKDRNYEFRRLVKSKKNLDIYIQGRWHNIDGSLNVGDVEGEIILAKPIHYPLDAGFEKVVTFKKTVPDVVGRGSWEYRPIVTYVINERKRITRPLPSQLVEVDCDFKETQ